jgi:hypothetical protein
MASGLVTYAGDFLGRELDLKHQVSDRRSAFNIEPYVVFIPGDVGLYLIGLNDACPIHINNVGNGVVYILEMETFNLCYQTLFE